MSEGMRSNITGTGHRGGMKMPSLKYMLMATGAIAVLGAAAAISVVALNSGGSGKPLEVVIAETPTPIMATATPYSTATPTLTPYPTATATPFPTATAAATAVPPSPTPPSSPTPQQPTATATIVVAPTPPKPTTTVVAGPTQEQLRQKLSSLDEIMNAKGLTLDIEGKDYKGYAQKAIGVFEAGYYLTKGKTPQQDRINIHIMVDGQYADIGRGNKIPPPNTIGAISFTSSTDQYILIRGDETPKQVLESLVHEGGHAAAASINSIGDRKPETAALLEAQAYTFEAAWNRTVYDFLGKGQSKYPKKDTYTKWIGDAVKFYEEAVKKPTLDNRHAVGTPLQWLRAREKGMLKLGEPLSAQQAYALFLDLVTTPKNDDEAVNFVQSILSKVDRDSQGNPDLSFMINYAGSRLDPKGTKGGPISPGINVLTP